MKDISSEAVREKQEHIVVRLGDELDRLIKIGAFLRECLENELLAGMGYKKAGLPPGASKAYKELATTIESVVSAKVRFDKAAKQMSDVMTPLEERFAVLQFLKALSPGDRKEMIRQIKDWEAAKALVPTESTFKAEDVEQRADSDSQD